MRLLLMSVSIALTTSACGTTALDMAQAKPGAEGDVFAVAGEFTLSTSDVRREYEAYVKSSFPVSMHAAQLVDKASFRAYGEKMAIQYLLISAAREAGKTKGEGPEILLRAALREALSEIFLRGQADLSPLTDSKAFRELNETMVDKLYTENKKKYEDTTVDEKTAKAALRLALVRKKQEILENFLVRKRLEIIQDQVKKLKYDIRYKG